ncbi:MAG: signal peptidase I [bacterium]|nr:signal peptidase I [bacterium]
MEELKKERDSFGGALGLFFWELLKAFILAMVIIVPIRYFVVQPFFVRGSSMEPSFHDGEYLVIDQLSYRFRDPRRGEVIVFQYPQDHTKFFIKRVIGLPGEDIQVNDGRVIISNSAYPSGAEIEELKYLASGVRTGGQINIHLNDGEYFILGDNRSESSDSRLWGAVKRDEIIGRAWIRLWPLNRMLLFYPISPRFITAT